MARRVVLAILLGVSGAMTAACAASAPPEVTMPEAARGAESEAAASAELIRGAWNFGDPAASEQRFRELSEQARQRGEQALVLELQTQLARAQGLSRRFGEATATLAEVEAQLGGQPARVRVRWLLEQGRVVNSSGQPEPARPSFERALELAREARLDNLAVDAAHMVAITFMSETDQAIAWNDRALELARGSAQPDARRWLGSLLNNQGWSYYEKGDYNRALQLFQEALEYRQTQSDARATRIARWCVGKALRALQRVQQALEIQEALLAEKSAVGEPAGFVQEELGECYLALGDADRARLHFAQAYQELAKDEGFARAEVSRLERLGRLGGVL